MSEKRNRGLIRFIKDSFAGINQKYETSISRSLHVTGASSIANIALGLGKLGMGVFSLSLFTCVSALYTFGMVIAKYCALAGIFKTNSVKAQYRYYTLSAMILIVASVLYIGYSVRLFFYPANPVYNEYVAIGIATFTFTELVLNIRGVIITRHNHDPLIHAIKMINLASSLICLVLTQTALLSFASTAVDIHPAVNGLMGVIMGAVATLLGVYMLIRIRRIKAGKDHGRYYRKVKKLMKKEEIELAIKPYYYKETEENKIELYVKIKNAIEDDSFSLLQEIAEDQLNIRLLELAPQLINQTGGFEND